MSADSAVIIASFPTVWGSTEYRVVEARAIDTLSNYTTTEQQDAIRAAHFENAIPFFDYEMALEYACELAEDCDILEYGILSFEFDRPLVHMTSEQIEAILYPQDFVSPQLQEDIAAIEEQDEYIDPELLARLFPPELEEEPDAEISPELAAILYPQDEQAFETAPDPDLAFVPCPLCDEEYCPTSDTCLTKAIEMLKQARGALLSARDCIAFDGSLDEENDTLIANKALDKIDAALDAIPNTIPGWTGTTRGSIMPEDKLATDLDNDLAATAKQAQDILSGND